MSAKSTQHHMIASIEDASILRKFTILFLLMSIIPTTLLYYFYLQVRDTGRIQITEGNFNLTLVLVVLGVLVGYLAMRAVLKRLVDLTKSNQDVLVKVLDPEKVKELSAEGNEINALAKTFHEITHSLEDNIKSLELAKRKLHSIMGRVGQGIAQMNNIDSFLDLILETVTDALLGRVGILLLVDESEEELWVKTVYGMRFDSDHEVRLKIIEGTTIDSVIKSKRPLVISKMDGELSKHEQSMLFEPPMICAPLVTQDHVTGVIIVSGRNGEDDFDDEEKTLLMHLASQTAVAIENARLNRDIESTYFETISALALAVDARDKYSRGHLDRVANHCIQIGKKLGLEAEDLKTLRDAARLHDLGKIGIPDEVLHKPGSLNEQEWILMRRHPEIGEDIIKPIRSLQHLCDIIRHHHEKLDGSGYPDGLKGDEITPLVRITTVADIYDALTTDRPYRKRMTPKEACDELRSMGEKLDQDIVEAFIETLDEE